MFWRKQMSDDLICYCFGYTAGDIQRDIEENGRSLIMEKIMVEKKAGACNCVEKNPQKR